MSSMILLRSAKGSSKSKTRMKGEMLLLVVLDFIRNRLQLPDIADYLSISTYESRAGIAPQAGF